MEAKISSLLGEVSAPVHHCPRCHSLFVDSQSCESCGLVFQKVDEKDCFSLCEEFWAERPSWMGLYGLRPLRAPSLYLIALHSRLRRVLFQLSEKQKHDEKTHLLALEFSCGLEEYLFSGGMLNASFWQDIAPQWQEWGKEKVQELTPARRPSLSDNIARFFSFYDFPVIKLMRHLALALSLFLVVIACLEVLVLF